MWLFALFQAETLFGRIVKTGMCGAAAVALYAGLTSTPQSGAQIALSLAVIAALWLHGYREGRRSSYASAQCEAEIREDEGRIRVAGGGVDLTLHLVSRTLTVNKVAKRFVSTDAPGEFQRLRSGRFEWPFRALAVEPEPELKSRVECQELWRSFRSVISTMGGRARRRSTSGHRRDHELAGEREIDVYWKQSGQGDRLLFSVTGPAEKYEAIERAFSIFAAWIDQRRRSTARDRTPEQCGGVATRLGSETAGGRTRPRAAQRGRPLR